MYSSVLLTVQFDLCADYGRAEADRIVAKEAENFEYRQQLEYRYTHVYIETKVQLEDRYTHVYIHTKVQLEDKYTHVYIHTKVQR